MPESFVPRVSPLRPFDVDTVSLLETLPGEQADSVAQLIRERDNLFVLHHALLDAERAPSLEAQLRVLVGAIRQVGFGRVVVAVRDAALDPTLVVATGFSDHDERTLRAAVSSGERWRARFLEIERFRIGQSAYYLDGRDPWVEREFRGASASALVLGDDPEWSPRDLLVIPLRGSDGRLLATLTLDEAEDRRRPTLTRVRTVELFAQQVAQCIERASLVELAARRAERLQRLQEVGRALARTLDEHEIVRELARQIGAVMPSDLLLVTQPDLDRGRTVTLLRVASGIEEPVFGSAPLGDGPIAEVARTGRALRVERVRPATAAETASDPLGATSGSLLAVPMMVGRELVGVLALWSGREDTYGAEDEEMLRAIGSHVATAIVNARLYAESQRERRQIEALADVARAVGESLKLDEVLNLILRHVGALLRAEGACIGLRSEDRVQVVAGVGTGRLLGDAWLPIDGSLTGRAIQTCSTVISNDVAHESTSHRPTQRAAAIGKVAIAPLVTANGAIGALAVFNRGADFTDEDARVLQRLADHVAVAIVNARLFEEAAAATREWTVAFDAIAGGMALLDAEGRIVRVNAGALRLLGEPSRESLVGRNFREALFGDSPPSGGPVVDALGDGDLPPATARGTVRSTARGRVFDLAASPHPSGGAVVAFDDVTEHHALAERYRLVVDTASDAIVITGTDRRIAFTNPAALELFGASGDVTGLPVSALVPPEVFDEVKRREDRALAGEPQRYEATLLRMDGERRSVAISTAPLLELGEITGIVASLRDVTEERRARDAVAHSEARYRNLFETASDAIYTMDGRGYFTSVNEATCALVALPREELLGRSLLPFLAPEDLDRVTELFRDARGGESRSYECVIVRQGGERRTLSVTNTPIRRGAAVVGVLGIARDVTVEQEREAALARSEARYTRLVESASDAIFTVDEEGSFASVNRALELSTGRERAALLGRPATELCDPRDRDVMSQLLQATLAGSRQRGEFRYASAGGDERWGSIITAPIVEDGRLRGALAVVRDVTDEKRLMGQLLQQEKLAAIGQLVSGVAHELNNPLAGVMAFSQILLATPGVEGEERSAVETIHQEARRAAKIVSNLLTFARQHHPERTETDVNRVLVDTLELRRYALRVGQVEVELSLDSGVPLTWADPFQIQQVLLNLLGNAEHALDGWDGERRITLRTSWAGTDADPIVVAIGDSGPGIPPEQIERIFNPFYTTKPVGQGTGLGLSISDGIVREHGGRIRVESRPGRGATFHVELPRVSPPDAMSDPESALPAQRRAG